TFVPTSQRSRTGSAACLLDRSIRANIMDAHNTRTMIIALIVIILACANRSNNLPTRAWEQRRSAIRNNAVNQKKSYFEREMGRRFFCLEGFQASTRPLSCAAVAYAGKV